MHTTLSAYNDTNITYNHSCFYNLKWTGIEPQTHDGYEMIYLKNGDLTYLVDGKSYRVKKNSLIFTRPGKRHIVLFNSSEVYDRYDIIIDENQLMSAFKELIPDSIDVLKLGDYQHISELFSKMDNYFNHFDNDTYKKLLINLSNEILCNIAIISEKKEAPVPTSGFTENPIITAAIEYIDRNIDTIFSLDTLANELFISKSYLHQLFCEHLKISPQKYISGKRLMLLQKEIRSGKKPTEAYIKYGFSDYSTFYRAYKKHFGYPPSEEGMHESVREIII